MSTVLDKLHEGAGVINDAAELHNFLVQLHEAWDADIETAHLAEDRVKSRVLELIADGHPEARELARELVEMDSWSVERWYA